MRTSIALYRKNSPLYSNALKILGMLGDTQTTELVIITLAEDVPTREAYELFLYAKEKVQVACDRLIVNRFISARFTAQSYKTLSSGFVLIKSSKWCQSLQFAKYTHDAMSDTIPSKTYQSDVKLI